MSMAQGFHAILPIFRPTPRDGGTQLPHHPHLDAVNSPELNCQQRDHAPIVEDSMTANQRTTNSYGRPVVRNCADLVPIVGHSSVSATMRIPLHCVGASGNSFRSPFPQFRPC